MAENRLVRLAVEHLRMAAEAFGASDLVSEIFGERGQHTRLALGIHEMPMDAAVQLAMTAEVTD